MIKVIIAGSRGFTNYDLLASTCEHMLQNHEDVEIVSGGANGADKLGEIFAEEKGYEIKQFVPEWSIHGGAAGYLRNKTMAAYADALIAFWDGTSKGTSHMIQIAGQLDLKIKVCKY